MFKERARRLLRKKWKTQELAEELFAILSHDGPLEHKGTITLIPDGDQPVIDVQIPGPVPTTPLITATHPDPGADGQDGLIGFVPFVQDPTGDTSGGGFDDVATPGGSGNQLPDRDDSGDTQTDTPQDDPRSTPVTTLGRVVSGSGTDYVVGVWLDDPDEGNANYWMEIPAKVMQIDSGETIPADSIVYVTLFYPAGRSGVVAYVQPPVVL